MKRVGKLRETTPHKLNTTVPIPTAKTPFKNSSVFFIYKGFGLSGSTLWKSSDNDRKIANPITGPPVTTVQK